jgi:3-carboxy-cis,cis-muconate cycloisomerase
MVGPVDLTFSTPAMAAIFAAEARVRHMLDFEAALARAEARAEVIPAEAAAVIAAASQVERFDLAALEEEAAVAGTPAIPLVRMLTALVAGDARRFVHWGATSQDAVDTALVLQMRAGFDELIAGVLAIGAACAALAERYRHTPMAGRTLLQQALPITFGLKAARWLALATRQAQRLHELRARVLVVQFGGAAGTLASLGDAGLRVTELLAEELGLAVPELPWHAERDRIGEVAAALGVAAGTLAKIASDVALLAQTEVGEVAEASVAGKGGSSALPQKRNPVDATFALAAARLAQGAVTTILGALAQEHERAVGGWQVEWVALPALFCHAAGTIARIQAAVTGLVPDPERMQANLALTDGLIMAESVTMALAPQLGRLEAYRLVREACERAGAQGIPLRQALLDNAQVCAALSPSAIDRALDPAAYLGSTDTFIDRALAAFQAFQATM